MKYTHQFTEGLDAVRRDSIRENYSCHTVLLLFSNSHVENVDETAKTNLSQSEVGQSGQLAKYLVQAVGSPVHHCQIHTAIQSILCWNLEVQLSEIMTMCRLGLVRRNKLTKLRCFPFNFLRVCFSVNARFSCCEMRGDNCHCRFLVGV